MSTMPKTPKTEKTISVAKYAKSLRVTPQVIYQRIATGKLVEGKDWIRERQERFLKRIVVKSTRRSKK